MSNKKRSESQRAIFSSSRPAGGKCRAVPQGSSKCRNNAKEVKREVETETIKAETVKIIPISPLAVDILVKDDSSSWEERSENYEAGHCGHDAHALAQDIAKVMRDDRALERLYEIGKANRNPSGRSFKVHRPGAEPKL